MPETLSAVERRILNFLADYLREHTYQPSIREIGRQFGIRSTKTVSEHLQSLANKGYIERDGARSRGVRIRGLDLRRAPTLIPLYGRVAAGDPVLLRDNVEREYGVDPALVRSPDSFFLRVAGRSMERAGILDGDLVLIEPAGTGEVGDGDIVAARVDGGATVKRFSDRDGQVTLRPEGPEGEPIVVSEHQDFAVLGRVAGLVRSVGAAG